MTLKKIEDSWNLKSYFFHKTPIDIAKENDNQEILNLLTSGENT